MYAVEIYALDHWAVLFTSDDEEKALAAYEERVVRHPNNRYRLIRIVKWTDAKTAA